MERQIEPIEQQLRNLGREWAAAELRGDTAFLERTLAHRFVGTSSRGDLLSKEEWLDRHRSGELKHQAFDWSGEHVTVYGDAAIVTGREIVRGRYRDREVDGEFRTTQVFVYQNGRWVLAGIAASATWSKLLLATGGSPIHLPFGAGDIIYFRDFEDYQRLRALADAKVLFVVIGGGFIGSEIAAALTMVGKKVTMVFLEDAVGGLVFPGDLAHHLNDQYRGKGVEIIANESVASVQREGERLLVRTGSGRAIYTDGLVAGIGLHPNIELAQMAGLKIENGIMVNERLETSFPDIYAAGDVENFFHAALGKRVRVEHEDNAVFMGKLAGRNMAGASETYDRIPMFYSDLFEFGYEAVGETSSKMVCNL